MTDQMHPAYGEELLPLWQRIAWMAAVWFASVALLGAVSWLLKLWLAP